MNRPIHSTSSRQPMIGGIDDGVRVLLGNIPNNEFERTGVNWNAHSFLLLRRGSLLAFLTPLYTSYLYRKRLCSRMLAAFFGRGKGEGMELAVTTSDPVFYQSDRLEFSTAVVREEYYAPHVHPARFQVELVLDGETECGIGRQRFTLSRQHYSLVNPDTEHYNITRQWKHALFLIFDRDIVDETAWQIYRFMSHPVAFVRKDSAVFA